MDAVWVIAVNTEILASTSVNLYHLSPPHLPVGIINAMSAISPIIATVTIAVSPFLNALEAIKPKQKGITKSMIILMLSPPCKVLAVASMR